MKLFTIPFAGGSSYSFGQWHQYIKKTVQVVNLDYSGHGKRIDKELASSLNVTIDDIVEQIINNMDEEPFLIYGHSMGGIVAYQASIILEKRYGLKSAVTFIGACRPPHVFNKRGHYDISYDEIVQGLIDNHRITKKLADTQYFKKSIYPAIENDYRIMYEYDYHYYDNEKLSSKVICLYGSKDKNVLYTDMLGWDQYASNKVLYKRVDAKHYFVEDHAAYVCNIINEALDNKLGGIE